MISFPTSGGIIQRLRKFKFEKIKKCPVFLYSEEDVKHIARQAGAKQFTIEKMAKDYLALQKNLWVKARFKFLLSGPGNIIFHFSQSVNVI